MNKLFFLVTFLVSTTLVTAQSDYWQQEVNYKINVKLNDKAHTLSAFETIEYINNSPDTLNFIYMHLWPNAYKNNKTALATQLYENGDLKLFYADDKERGFIDSLDFKTNEKALTWSLTEEHIDIAKIELSERLAPGKKTTISTPFKVKIPKGIFSRLGHMGESYQITQWYPKPAVYDKNGWNEMPYLTQGEFYSEYGSFDVSIDLPKNYVVGATGDLVDGEKELDWLNEKAKITSEIISYDKTDNDFPESSKERKTLRYKQSQVHDFAWFADKRYHVLKGEVELPHTKEKVATWAMYTNAEADLWVNSIEYLNDAIYYYSLWNGDYPYKHCTAVDGALSAGGGMEYPNVTVIGRSGNAFLLETVIMHEVGHNWFYGILGSNERMHPWMDEGLNSFNENRYIETKHPEANIAGDGRLSKILEALDMDRYLHKEQYYVGYQFVARKNLDQPIELPSHEYTNINYGTIVYGKSALSFDYLMAYLGEETMDRAMRAYFDKWKFKHPQPEDFRAVIEEQSGKNLSWFFDNMINSTRKLDYKVLESKKSENGYSIKVKNTGDFVAPFCISGIKNDSVITTQWFEGFDKLNQINFVNGDFDQFRIDANLDLPETRRKNNTLKTKGLLKRVEPLKLQTLGSIENPDKSQIFWTPTMGWNTNDKTMLGLAFYNAFIPQKRFEYALMPMYSFGANDWVGSGMINYNILPKSGIFRQVSLGVGAQKYSGYIEDPVSIGFSKITPHLNLYFNKKTARSTKSNILTLRGIGTNEEFEVSCDDGTCFPHESTTKRLFGQVIFTHNNKTTLNPYSYMLKGEVNKEFVKLSFEGNFKIDYKKENKSFDIRLFAGAFPLNTSNNPSYNFRMDGLTGFYDYTYDHVYLDRGGKNNVLHQQFVLADGGFKMAAPSGQSNLWLAALNLKADIPIPVPIGMFADLGYNDKGKLIYDFGIHVPIAKNIFEVYFPIAYSSDIKDYVDANGLNYGDLIRFTLHLENVNPFQLLRDLEF